MRQSSGQINRRGRFSNAAFLICNRDDGSHTLLPPPMRMVNRADAIQQPSPYIWVLPAECPLALGHFTFVTYSSAREKWKFATRSVEISQVLFWERGSGSAQDL